MYTDAEIMAEALSASGWRESEMPKSKLEQHARAATDEVDSKLRLVYTVPFGDSPDNIPGLIGRIATALACYQATLDWYGSTDLDDKDPVVRRWKWAAETLESLRKGESSLGIEQGGGEDDEGGYVVNPSYSGLIEASHFDAFGDPGGYGRWDRGYGFG